MATSSQSCLATLEFLADDPKYDEEKPYYLHAAASVAIDEDTVELTNVRWDKMAVPMHSMRNRPDLSLERNGFCFVHHDSQYCLDPAAIQEYKDETEKFMHDHFRATFVHCYDYKRRKNVPVAAEAFDPRDPKVEDQVAIGAHVDISVDTVGQRVKQMLTEEQCKLYFNSEHRIRLVNTWRSTLPIAHDRPLAFCDYATVDSKDLIATERVYPTRLLEIYHLKYNSGQDWYWLPEQLRDELFMFMTFDSLPGEMNARYCPHVSFENPLAPAGSPPRQSVETRTLVITKI